MKCPNHPQADATGYCSVCGTFGCPECLTLHEGNLLCSKHYRPIARKIEEERRTLEQRRKHPRQRLVVRYLDGRTLYGVSFALNTREPAFHLDLVDANGTPVGQTVPVRFQDLKAVFLVKSFDGHFDKSLRYREYTPEGGELVVRFRDGEVVRGFSLQRYDPVEPRFHLIPSDPATNNISIVVERSAVEGVYAPEEYKAKLIEEREALGSDASGISQEESTGDFYFETRNYAAALEQYLDAAHKFPQVRRLQKKLFLTRYNVGIEHIKRREYDKALASLEFVLKADPRNERVRKKVAQLRHIVEKTQRKSAAPEPQP